MLYMMYTSVVCWVLLTHKNRNNEKEKEKGKSIMVVKVLKSYRIAILL